MNFRHLKNSLRSESGAEREASEFMIMGEKDRVSQGESAWPAYDSGLESKAQRFLPIIEQVEGSNETENFVNYLKTRFSGRLGNLVGLELGGSGSNFFRELNIAMGSGQGFVNTYGITLVDHRTGEQKASDLSCNHKVLEGDIYFGNNRPVLDKFKMLPDKDRPDFIFEDMIMPMGMANYSPNFFYLSLNDWFKILRPGGVFLAQCPIEFGDFDYGYGIEETDDFFKRFGKLKSEKDEYSIKYISRGRLLKIEKNTECSLPRLKDKI
jgi:hypothetical protein